MRHSLSLLAGLGLVLSGAGNAVAQDAGAEFFEKKVRPVLVEHCYKCHSQESKKQRGGLAVDSRPALLEGGDTGPAVVPGKPGESLLLKAMRYEPGSDLKMPPDRKLPGSVLADLEKWVAMGAPGPHAGAEKKVAKKGFDLEEGRKFWAFQPVKRPTTPPVKDEAWPRGNVDRFILNKLEAKGLKPVQDAARATLLRRVYFDLIGLPPTPEQIDAFVKDQAPDAFAKVVDELLASPHFGERWGRHWLDVVRFAQSSGGGRSLLLKEAWRFRDYVIKVFNADKPFNQFIVEQIAGDLLPYSTPEERYEFLVATGFLALGPTNYERQDKPVLEMDVIDEQIDTTGKAFLGMTIGCARCHDHKFDPIPTKDYYALAGIFKSTKTLIHENVSKWVEQPLPMPPELAEQVKKHDAAVAALKKQIALVKAADKKAGKAAMGALAANELPGIVIDDTQAKKVGPWKHSTFTKTYIGEGYLYDDRGAKADKTLTFVPEFEKAGVYEVRLAYVPATNRADKVPVLVFHADGEKTVHVNQQKTPPIDGRFVSLGKYRFEPGNQWFVMVSTGGTNGHVIADAVQFLPEDLLDAAPAAPVKAARRPTADLKQLEAQLKKLQTGGPARPMAMSVAEAAKVEDTNLCIRGNYHNRGAKVPRGFLQVATVGKMPTIPAKESGRRKLAEWLASKDNPLTARVAVNRVWHHLFGVGLVRTVDNFGRTGELPSHPELLDYLADRFVAEGWSVKKLVREVVLSRTYQLASTTDDAELRRRAVAADPENRLLWRANRRRLEAEALRDMILAVSGQLDRTVGGPNLRQGPVVERDYVFDDVRRSVYTPIFRNRLLELFEVFDFADPNMVMGKRNVSTVSTQALYFMNSPFVMDQARHAARRSLAEKVDDAQRLERAYRVALGRSPTERERELALQFVRDSADPAAAWERVYQALFACVDFRYVN